MRIRLRFLTARRSTFPGVGRLAADWPAVLPAFHDRYTNIFNRPPPTGHTLRAGRTHCCCSCSARTTWGGSGFIVESLGGPRYGNAFAGGSAGNTSGASSALAPNRCAAL